MKHVTLLSIIMVTASCRSAVVPGKALPLSESIGVVGMQAGKSCLQIANSSIPANSRIRTVGLAGRQTVQVARVGENDPSCLNIAGVPASARGYDVYFDVEPPVAEMPVIGLLNYRGKIARDGDLVSADLAGDGHLEYFRSCTSAEGIHFTAWSGRPITGKLVWHRYYYLGYDVSPTCTQAELGFGN